jgi:hypothetical protein
VILFLIDLHEQPLQVSLTPSIPKASRSAMQIVGKQSSWSSLSAVMPVWPSLVTQAFGALFKTDCASPAMSLT